MDSAAFIAGFLHWLVAAGSAGFGVALYYFGFNKTKC
jgi:hypothetical protein